jgi:hypothetical protein
MDAHQTLRKRLKYAGNHRTSLRRMWWKGESEQTLTIFRTTAHWPTAQPTIGRPEILDFYWNSKSLKPGKLGFHGIQPPEGFGISENPKTKKGLLRLCGGPMGGCAEDGQSLLGFPFPSHPSKRCSVIPGILQSFPQSLVCIHLTLGASSQWSPLSKPVFITHIRLTEMISVHPSRLIV